MINMNLSIHLRNSKLGKTKISEMILNMDMGVSAPREVNTMVKKLLTYNNTSNCKEQNPQVDNYLRILLLTILV